jgi:hypothetical protein
VLLLALALSAQAGPLTVNISDPYVIAVVLECDGSLMKATVRDGRAMFDAVPEGCTVDLIRRTGLIDQAGEWTCGLDGCTMDDVHHAEISDATGRINVVVTGDIAGTSSLEVACLSGHRARQVLEEATATFDGVPAEDCSLLFKGGAPAKFRGIGQGTWYCSLVGTTAICNTR